MPLNNQTKSSKYLISAHKVNVVRTVAFTLCELHFWGEKSVKPYWKKNDKNIFSYLTYFAKNVYIFLYIYLDESRTQLYDI